MNSKKFKMLNALIACMSFTFQTCFGQTIANEHLAKTVRDRQISIYNQFQTAGQIVAFTKLYIGAQEGDRAQAFFAHYKVSLDDKLLKLKVVGSELMNATSGAKIAIFTTAASDELIFNGKTILLNSKNSFDQKLQHIETILPLPKAKSFSHLALISTAYADDVDDMLTNNTLLTLGTGVLGGIVGFLIAAIVGELLVDIIGVAATILIPILICALVGAGLGYHYSKKDMMDKLKDLSLNCPKGGSGAMVVNLGQTKARVNFDGGYPTNFDTLIDGVQTTYFVQSKKSTWEFTGKQIAGKPPVSDLEKIDYTERENLTLRALQSAAVVCSHPEILAKFSALVDKVTQSKREPSTQPNLSTTGSATQQGK